MERVKRVSISAFAFNFTTARFSALFSHVLTPCNLSRLSLSLFLHLRNGSLSPCFERSVTAPPPRLLHLGPSFARQTLRNNGQSYVRQRLLPRFRRFLNAFLPRLSFSIFFFFTSQYQPKRCFSKSRACLVEPRYFVRSCFQNKAAVFLEKFI